MNLRNFKLNSLLQTDDVVFTWETTLSYNQGQWSASKAHGLAFAPLCFGIVELNNSGIWQPIVNTPNMDLVGGLVMSDTSQVQVSVYVYSSTPSSVKVRIFGLLPPNQGNTNIAVPTGFSNFKINSNQIADVLVAQGKVSLPNNTNSQLVYTHNLGYLPRVMLWEELQDSKIIPINPGVIRRTGVSYSEARTPILSNTELRFWNYSTYLPETATIYYRIYGGSNA